MATTEDNKMLTIDVGVNGGICYRNEKGDINCAKPSKSFDENVKIIDNLIGDNICLSDVKIYIEHQSLRKPDIISGRWFSIHKLCIHYETLKSVCSCLGGEPISVTPQEWQSIFFLKGKTYKDKKKRLKEIATKLFPELKVNLWNCDALLLLYYKTKIKDGYKIRRTRG